MEGITYAGNHGLEILHPDGTKFSHPMPPGYVVFTTYSMPPWYVVFAKHPMPPGYVVCAKYPMSPGYVVFAAFSSFHGTTTLLHIPCHQGTLSFHCLFTISLNRGKSFFLYIPKTGFVVCSLYCIPKPNTSSFLSISKLYCSTSSISLSLNCGTRLF